MLNPNVLDMLCSNGLDKLSALFNEAILSPYLSSVRFHKAVASPRSQHLRLNF